MPAKSFPMVTICIKCTAFYAVTPGTAFPTHRLQQFDKFQFILLQNQAHQTLCTFVDNALQGDAEFIPNFLR